MPLQNQYGVYERTNVQTADQQKLILMLYDGLIRYLNKAEQKIAAQDYEAAHNYLIRGRNIVSELLATLKPEKAGEVGKNLRNLYVYIFNRIVEANLAKDPKIVAEVVQVMSTLREGWANMKPQTRRHQDPNARISISS